MQAMALEQLTHKYICGYKEFFVNWDKLVCTHGRVLTC